MFKPARMEIKVLSEKILLKEKRDVLRLHLYTKLLEHRIKPFENDIDILIELYEFGGYNDSETQAAFINLCLSKKLRKSAQSVRNMLSAYTKLKVLEKPRNRVLKLSETYIPKVVCDKIVLQPLISHKN